MLLRQGFLLACFTDKALGAEGLSHLPRAAQLMSTRAKTGTQVVGLQQWRSLLNSAAEVLRLRKPPSPWSVQPLFEKHRLGRKAGSSWSRGETG